MYKYEDIAFRVIERQDLDILRKLHNDQSTILNLYNIDYVDEEDQLEWWKSLHKKKTDRRYVLCYAEQPEVVYGRLRIMNINTGHNNCELGIDILPEYRRKGLATKSYRMVLEFLFKHFNMHMVYLRVADFNQDAVKVYEQAGFKKTGLLPQYFYRHGKYWDYIIMSLTREEFIQNRDNRI